MDLTPRAQGPGRQQLVGVCWQGVTRGTTTLPRSQAEVFLS